MSSFKNSNNVFEQVNKQAENSKLSASQKSKLQERKRESMPPIVVTNYAKAINEYQMLSKSPRKLRGNTTCLNRKGFCIAQNNLTGGYVSSMKGSVLRIQIHC